MTTSESKINLVCLSNAGDTIDWDIGKCFNCPPEPKALLDFIESHLVSHPADGWLFWDPGLGTPDGDYLLAKLSGSADVWHAGLKLGLSGQPKIIDYVQPIWMLNRDPNLVIEASSWRLSLRACLIRAEILKQLGGPDPNFATLAWAGLELGFRYIRKGVFIRHDPNLVIKEIRGETIKIPLQDQLRFLRAGFDHRWRLWAGFRAIISGEENLVDLHRAGQKIRDDDPLPGKNPYRHEIEKVAIDNENQRVSVLIPTLRRYPYLRMLLGQLRTQTVEPYEIIIVDQTPSEFRDQELLYDFSDLPLRYFTLDQAGQCSSRNLGLQKAVGDFILFIDDDDEVPSDLIEKHLQTLHQFQINVSNGVAHEVGTGKLPEDYRLMRISSVFPTNNTMIRRDVLQKSGLFDLAYDHGQRADHDLGMRLYLSGELMVLNPEISVFHHHAPMGGLREHKARVETRAASRQHLFRQNLPTVSDIYLAKRYFSQTQVREILWINLLGTFSIQGGIFKRLTKVLISLLILPHSLWVLTTRSLAADDMLKHYPRIPELETEEKT